ncbi:MAG TPA: S9 family peptidase [Bryobacteraceae bacterium]|nr:S9 family peptidase [Bryobacteraceae bacterium]
MRSASVAALVFVTCASAQTIPQVLATIAGTTQYGETAVSPGGRWAAWTVNLRNKDNTASRNSEVWVLDLQASGAKPRHLTVAAGFHEEHGLAFAPGSAQLAYLSDAASPGQLQLYIQPLAMGPARRLTSLTGRLAEPRWSPDGHKIAFLFTDGAKGAAGPLEAAAKETGVIEEVFHEQRLYIADPASGAARAITPDDTYVYEYDWAPDSDRLACTAAKGNGDNNWWIAQLFTVSSVSGAMANVHKPERQIANPRWSPAGDRIAFIGGLMSDEGSTGGDIFSVPAQGGEATNLTPARHSSPGWMQWLSNGRILFTETIDGGTALASLNPIDQQTETLWSGGESWKSGDASTFVASADGGVLAASRSSWTAAPEVWAGKRGEWSQRTHANDAMKPLWGQSSKLHWKSEGTDVQGWLLYPVNYDAAKRYPMVVSIHGGPSSARKPSWPAGHFDLSALSSQGYFVLFPNPRGSYGAGESFTRANVKDFGHGDLRDIEAGVDEALRTLPVDKDRVGVAGWSYGGYMTMWTVTQSTRFRAAVAGAGIANWQSYYGENLIDQWMIPFFGASVYDDPAVYARSSPMTYIRNVHTPTLIVVGDGDAECPAPQSYEFWHALKTLGVKTQLVVYPGEGHAFRKPENKRDVLERTMRWFNDNLRETPAPTGR